MKRSYLHLLVDMILLLGAVGLILTGLLLAFVLPAGSHQDSVWSLSRHEWGDIHFWIAMGIIAAALLHVTLNWGWVCSVIAKLLRATNTKPTLRRKLWTGITSVIVLVILVGGFLYTANISKVHVASGRDGGGHGTGAGHQEQNQQDVFTDEF